MNAIRIHSNGGPNVLKFEQIEIPKLSHGQVLIKNSVCGVNFIDIYHRSGQYKVAFPFTLGRDGAGVIEKILDDPQNSIKHDFKVGDKVAYSSNFSGSYADYCTAPIVNVTKIPPFISMEQAAASMLQGLTAHYLVKEGSYPVKTGDTVLVHAAAGGLGRIVTQIAKIQGASKVIGTTSTIEKAKIARESGCDEVILYTKQDLVKEVKKITNGKGVNVVYDSVGKDTFDRSLDCLSRRGFLVLFGASSGPVPPFDPIILSSKGSISLNRPTLFDYISTKEEFDARCSDIFTWIHEGKLILSVDKTFPLKDAAEAHKYIEGRNSTGKVLLIP